MLSRQVRITVLRSGTVVLDWFGGNWRWFIWLVPLRWLPEQTYGPRSRIKAISPESRQRHRGYVKLRIRLSMFPHDDKTFALAGDVREAGEPLETSSKDATFHEMLIRHEMLSNFL